MTTTPYQLRVASESAARNVIINGNMDFWQRGTSVVVNAANLRQADRFSVYNPGAFNVTYSQSGDVPTAAQSGFQSRFSTLLTWNATPTNGTVLQYRVEGHDLQPLHGGKRIRFQFWVKSSVTGTFGVTFENANEDRVYGTSYTISAANTWQKVSIDLPTDTTGTWAFDNTLGMMINIGAGGTVSGSTVSTLNTWTSTSSARTISTQTSQVNGGTFQVAQVALFPGAYDSTASIPFQRAGRSIAHELQMCQRYYEKSYNIDISVPTNTQSPGLREYSLGSNSIVAAVEYGSSPFRVEKRAVPTVTTYSYTSSTSGVASRADTLADLTASSAQVIYAATSGFGVRNASGGTLTIGAQAIAFHWAAEAEI